MVMLMNVEPSGKLIKRKFDENEETTLALAH
jgi:hypothetical protein